MPWRRLLCDSSWDVFSGEECTSAFKWKGKVGPLKKLEKNPRFHKLFLQFGEVWNLKSNVLEQLDEFTSLVYGQNRESSMDGFLTKPLRKIVGEDEKLTSKPKVELARLPPCRPALKPHLQRVNHRVADKSILEKPNPYDDGQGWIKTEDGVLEPVWSCDATLPNSLVDLLDTGDRVEEEEEEEENEDGRV